jgi:hypothetical protein
LLREEAAHMLGLDCRDVDSTVAKALQQQPPGDAQRGAARLRRKALNMEHVLVVATQFGIDRRSAGGWCSDCALSPQHHQQMTQRGAAVASIALHRFGATAAREVLIEELGDDCLIDAPNANATLAKPLHEVGDATQAIAERAPRASAVDEVLLVGLAVRRERTLVEPVDAADPRRLHCSHSGLLKWEDHWTRMHKLCLELRSAPLPSAGLRLRHAASRCTTYA